MVWNWNSTGPVGEGSLSNKKNLVSSVSGSFNTEIKSHVYACCMSVLVISIVLDSVYLLIFYSEKYSTWICGLPFVIYVVVNFLFQVIFVFLLFLGMVIYADEVETKEKEKLPEIKN